MGQQQPLEQTRGSTTRLRVDAQLTGLDPASWYAALEAVPNAVVVYAADRRILYLNRAGRAGAGLTLEQVIGRTDTELFPAHATREYLPLLDRVFTSRKAVSGECRVLAAGRNGEAPRPVVFSVSYTPVLDAEGAIESVIAITSDLTTTRRFEGEAYQLRAILENAAVPLLTLAPNGVIVTFNQYAQRLYGYAAHEVIGRPLAFLFDSNSEREAETLFERVRHGERVEYEGYRRHKLGRRLDLTLTLSPVLNERGELMSIVETAQPPSATSETRLRAVPPQVAETSPSRAVASIAHELNDALAVVEQHRTLLNDASLPEGALLDLELARRAARRSAALVAEVLAAHGQSTPLAPTAQGRSVETPLTGDGGGRPVVLVVDDDPKIRMSMQRLLGECEIVTLTAPSGLHALRILEERQVHAVVSDQVMPGMNGVQLLAIVRERWPNAARVLFTGDGSSAVVLEAVNRAETHKVLLKSMHALEIRNEIETSALVAARRTARG